jgi:hypothetical protein
LVSLSQFNLGLPGHSKFISIGTQFILHRQHHVFVEDNRIELASLRSILIDRALLSVMKDAPAGIAVLENFEAIGARGEKLLLEAKPRYSLDILFQ